MTQGLLTAARPQVCLERNGQHLTIDDKSLELLGGELWGSRIDSFSTGKQGYDVRRESYPLLVSDKEYRTPNAGLIPVLRQRALELGVELNVEAISEITQLPAPQNHHALSYPSVASFTRQHERGVIRVSGDFDRAVVVADLVRAFPESRLVVLAGKVAPLQRLHGKVAGQCKDVLPPGQIRLVHDRCRLELGDDEEMPRLILATFLAAGDIDFPASDLVLLLDAEECVRDQAQLALEQMDARFRLFGILRANQRLAPFVADTIMAVFGPELIDLMSWGRVRRWAQVLWVENRQQSIAVDPGTSNFAYRCYYHNERRNRRIKQIAVNCLEPKAPTAGEQGNRPRNVAILVDRVDHAVALGKMLPDWPIIAGDKIDTHGLPGSIRTRLKHGRRQPIGRCQIVLSDAAQRRNGSDLDVVIWAAGGTGVEGLPASWLAQMPGTNRPLLIVDFKDRFNAVTGTWSAKRNAAYEARDLFEIGVTPTQGRIRRFRSQQPSPKGGRR